jgi:hypothetical protein
MSTYVYIRSEPGLWTVGFYKPDGKWEAESDHSSSEAAAERVHWLNGKPASELFQTLVDIVRPVLCEDCETRPPVAGEDLCPDCRDNRAEAAYERSQGECFRGGEAAAYDAEQQAKIQRELK